MVLGEVTGNITADDKVEVAATGTMRGRHPGSARRPRRRRQVQGLDRHGQQKPGRSCVASHLDLGVDLASSVASAPRPAMEPVGAGTPRRARTSRRPSVALRPGTRGRVPDAAAGPALRRCSAGRSRARFATGKPEILMPGSAVRRERRLLSPAAARACTSIEVELPEPIPKRQPGERRRLVSPVRGSSTRRTRSISSSRGRCSTSCPPERLTSSAPRSSALLTRRRAADRLRASEAARRAARCIPRYRLLADDLIVREEPGEHRRRRYVHPNREIERAIAGLSVQSIHLQRNQMREILASKAGVG